MSDCVLNLLPVNEAERSAFEAAAPGALHVYAGRRTATPEQFAQATVLFGWPRPRDLARCKRLKWFQSMWAGTEEYTAPGVLPPGVLLTSSAGCNSQSVAEHLLSCLLALCRRLPRLRDSQRAHLWQPVDTVRTIDAATVLVLGAGHVGSDFALRCRLLGAHTVGLKRTPGPVPGFDEVHAIDRLDELLPAADVVALTLPGSPDTAGMMSAGRLAAMKRDAILLSAGRGSALDQEGLLAVLRSGHLWGAALDVTEPEPLPPDHPLWDAPNLLLTPHVAGGIRMELTRKNCVRLALENFRRYLAGQPLENVVSRPAGERAR